MFYSYGGLKLKIVAVLFFVTPQFCKTKFLRFDPILGSNNSGLKNSRIKNQHIFGIARTSAFIWHIWIGRKDKCCISVVWIHPSKLKIYILKIPHIRERINFSKKRLFCKKSKCKSAKIFLLVRKIFWLIGKLFWKLGKVFCVVGNICPSCICSSYFCCFLCLFFLCLRFLYMLIPRTSPSCEMGWHRVHTNHTTCIMYVLYYIHYIHLYTLYKWSVPAQSR